MLVGASRAAAGGSPGCPEGSEAQVRGARARLCPPRRRARASPSPAPPADSPAFACSFSLTWYVAQDNFDAGADGLRSPPPVRSSSTAAAGKRPWAPPAIARTAKALGPGGVGGSGFEDSSSSNGSAMAVGAGDGRGKGVGRGKGRRPSRRDPVDQLLNVPDVTGDSAAVVAAILNLFDDAAARLRQCQAGDERVLPLKRTRRLEVAEGGGKRVCVGECSCKLDYKRLAVRLSTTKSKVRASARAPPAPPVFAHALHLRFPLTIALPATRSCASCVHA